MSVSSRALRVKEMDAIRGAAMIAVCLSHSAGFVHGYGSTLGEVLITLGMVATPTFLLLSGMACGYISAGVHESAAEFRWRMLDRGLFLLLVAHLALGLTHATWVAPRAALLRSFYITDAVGVGLIVAAFCARRASRNALLASGLALFLFAAIASNFIAPHNSSARNAVRLFLGLGVGSEQDEGYLVPIVPYLGIFLVGIAGGKVYAVRRSVDRSILPIAFFCICLGLTCLALAVGAKLAGFAMKPYLSHAGYEIIYRLVDPRQKIPPGLGYVLAFGGAGILIAGLLAMASYYRRGEQLISMLSVMGRASLMTYIAQYWFYLYPTRVLGLNDLRGLWFIVFPLTLLTLWLFAWSWDRANYNRFLTLGLRNLHSGIVDANASIANRS